MVKRTLISQVEYAHIENLKRAETDKQEGLVPKDKIFAGWKTVNNEDLCPDNPCFSLKRPLKIELPPIIKNKKSLNDIFSNAIN